MSDSLTATILLRSSKEHSTLFQIITFSNPRFKLICGMRNEAATLRIPANRISLWFHNFRFAAKKIDVFSRVLFPGVFAVFNFLYWAYFLTVEQDNG